MKLKKTWLVAAAAILLLGTITAFATQGNASCDGLAENAGAGTQTTEGGNKEMPRLADTAMYRGIVTAISEEDDTTLVTLKQVDGTNFGATTKTLRLTKDTVRGFEAEQLVEGAYFEMHYGASGGAGKPVGENPNDTQNAISAMILTPAQFAVFNGEVVSIEQGGAGAKYSMMMKPIDGGEVVLFHVADETKIYMDENEIKAGVRLNLFTRGARTMSIPAQGAALEIRPYHAPAEVAVELITVQ